MNSTDDLMKVFSDCYEEAIKGKRSPDSIPELVRDQKVQRFIEYITRASSNYDDIPDQYLVALQTLVSILQFAYTNGVVDTGVSDTDYDKLYETMIRYGGNDIVSTPLPDYTSEIEQHSYPDLRGTLSKVYFLTDDEKLDSDMPNRRSLPEWVEHTQALYKANTGNDINLWDQYVHIMPKFDGVSVVLEYDAKGNLSHALLRGDTLNNETRDIKYLFGDYKKHKYCGMINTEHAVKCELMTTKQCLNEWNHSHIKEYKRPLSLVAAITNMDKEDVTEDLISMLLLVPLREQMKGDVPVMSLELLDSKNFAVKSCKLHEIVEMKKFINKHYRDINGLYCDGAVIRFIDPEIIKALGRTNDMPNYEVAYKYTEEVAYSKVVDVHFQLTVYGNIAPVLEVEPVVIKDRTITNISLGSMNRFKDLLLKKGDEVCVICDIIPYVVKNDKCKDNKDGRIIDPPAICPECKSPLTTVGSNYRCSNPDCPGKIMGAVRNYVDRMKIRGISTKKIEALYRAGYLKSILDLYKLDENISELITIPSFGETSIAGIVDAVNACRVVQGSRFMSAIGIENVGETTFSKILKKYTVNDLLDKCDDEASFKEDMIKIDGVGSTTAEAIVHGIIERKKLIKKLLKYILPVEENRNEFLVCFTKLPDPVIESYRPRIEAKGMGISERINMKVNILVTPSIALRPTKKVEYAKAHGIKIMTLKEFDNFICE